MYKIYLHRDQNNQIFYVGCTKSKYRPYEKYSESRRSIEWLNHCNNQFTVEIVAEGLTQDEAYQMEIELISKFKRKIDGGILVNKSTGGKSGTNGIIPWNKGIINETISGKNHPMYGKTHTDEAKKKMSEAQKGRKHSTESKLKRSGVNNKRSKKVIDILTGEIYASASDVAKLLNVEYTYFRKKLTGVVKNNTNYKYLE